MTKELVKDDGEMMLDDGISRLCPDHSKILKSPSRAPIRGASKQHLPQPILAAPIAEPALPPGWAAEPKWGRLPLPARPLHRRPRAPAPRRGTDMTPSFPEIQAAAAQLPADTGRDGELVAWGEGRLAF
ncbi:hypothetical protein OG613_01975 [Streptomyces sp. NBC_00015]|uniref:hypothetical protein n=1 Tax=Streptomyces sp. NBC_00015 TaxID=2903611 RepID=UPI003256748E